MHKSISTLHYEDKDFQVYAECDRELARFYRSLVPIDLNLTRFAPHVTIVRNELTELKSAWRKYDKLDVEFEYSPEITWDDTYWWLPVKCEFFKTLREEFGLLGIPPWNNNFHMTIGNTKK